MTEKKNLLGLDLEALTAELQELGINLSRQATTTLGSPVVRPTFTNDRSS